jgi:hypothetical protein
MKNYFTRCSKYFLAVCVGFLLSPHTRHLSHWHVVHRFHHLFHLLELFHKSIDLGDVFPLPLAILCLRDGVNESGFDLSKGVIELIIASMPLKASSLISISFIALPTPGIIPIRSFRLPIFLICCSWSIKSWKSNWFFRIFFSSFFLLRPHHTVPVLFLQGW